MYVTYHLSSAQELDSDIVEAIKIDFQSKSITLTIEEENDETAYLMSNPANKEILLKSIAQDKKGEFINISKDINRILLHLKRSQRPT